MKLTKWDFEPICLITTAILMVIVIMGSQVKTHKIVCNSTKQAKNK